MKEALKRIAAILIIFLIIVFAIFNLSENSKKSTESGYLQGMDSDYVEIIRSYQKYAEYIIDGNIEGVFQDNIFTISNIDETLSYHWENMLIEANIWSCGNLPKDESAFGFALMDLNDDESEELILLLRDYTVLAIFTIVNHKLTLIDAYWSKHRCAIFDTGMIYTLSSNSASQWYYQIQYISSENGSLKLLQEYGCSNDEYYKIIDGKKYSICEYDFLEFQKAYPALSDTEASDITKKSGIEYKPLFAT